MRLILFCGCLIALVGCTPVKSDEDNGAFKFPEAPIVVSPDELSPQYNAITYNQNTDPHSQVERDFRHHATERAAYEIFRDEEGSSQCSANKGRPEFSIFLVKSDRILKLKTRDRFELGPEELLRVVAENSAGCQSLYYRFAIVRR
jgi:hypothetical protein